MIGNMLFVMAVFCAGNVLRESHAAEPVGEKIRTVLWVGGFAHDFDAYVRILGEELPRRIPVQIEVVRDGQFLDRTEAQRPNVILMDHCFQSSKGVLTDGQKAKLLEWVRSGVGVVAVHASYYSFPEWKEAREIFGTQFTTHGNVDIHVIAKFTDRKHPISKDLPETLRLHTELYQSTPLAPDCHVLAVAKEENTTAEYPSIWTRDYGGGRVVVILPGHWPDAHQDKGFEQLVANSVLWTAKRAVK